MLRVVEDAFLGVVVIITQKSQIRPRCRMARQVLDGTLHRRHPPVLVRREPIRVVQVHLDQVLIVAIRPTRPSTRAVDKAAIRDAHVAAQQARKRLAQLRVERVDQVGFALLGELAVRGVAGQVGQPCPFHHEGADGGDAVGGGVGQAGRVEEDAVVGYACGRVEGEFERVA